MKTKKQIKDFINDNAIIENENENISDENSNIEVKYKDEFITINRKNNITKESKFVKLKDKFSPCELNCGNVINRQEIHYALYYYPVKHWRTSCYTCKRTVHPDGKTMIESNQKVPGIFNNYYRK